MQITSLSIAVQINGKGMRGEYQAVPVACTEAELRALIAAIAHNVTTKVLGK
mgnify:CR=1 FL=1